MSKRSVFVVQMMSRVQPPEGADWLDVADVKDKAAGEKWIKAKGEDGETYRVVAVVVKPCKIAVKQVRRVGLVSVDDLPGPLDEDPDREADK